MKKVFKKNQIIISALAIMIAVAGYLNFTKDKANSPLNDIDTILNTAMDDGTAINASDQGNNENALTADVSDTDVDFTDVSDISDEDSVLVGDNGELIKQENELAKGNDTGTVIDESTETSSPGEAILASTTLGSGFFTNAKLTREQTRSKNKQTLMDIVADTSVSDDQKQAAIDCIIAMTATAEMENAAELLLEAKGFEGVVVNIVENNVDVVVNAATITDAEIAQIMDIVMRKTNVSADDIVITSVVVEE